MLVPISRYCIQCTNAVLVHSLARAISRQATFLREYAFRCVLFIVLPNFYFRLPLISPLITTVRVINRPSQSLKTGSHRLWPYGPCLEKTSRTYM